MNGPVRPYGLIPIWHKRFDASICRLMVVPDHYDDNFLDAATDNALTRNYGSSVYRASMGAFSRSTNPLGNWDNMYDKIQSINLFMEKELQMM